MSNSRKLRSIPKPEGRREEDQPIGVPSAKSQDFEPIRASYRGSGKLAGKVALVTGGDHAIGRSVALHFAREGAELAIVYHRDREAVEETRRQVEAEGQVCRTYGSDLGKSGSCKELIGQVVEDFGRIDILVNNAEGPWPDGEIESIDLAQLEYVFRANLFSVFFLTQAALERMKPGSCIINTTSIPALGGRGHSLEHSSTQGAIIAFTRSISKTLIEREIRVNAVALGPLLPQRGWSCEGGALGPSFVFLASADSSFMSGQVLHPGGGAGT